jgi:lipopolysaccharide export system permease protein
VVRFQNVSAVEPTGGAAELKPRGGNQNELTLFELVHEIRSKASVIPKADLEAELYGRLARSLSVPLLPLMAVPLGMAAKRGRRAPGLIFAGLLLISFHHAIQFAQSLAQTGQAQPGSSIWGIFGIFISLCFWLFLTSLKRPGDTPITRAVAAVSDAAAWVRDLFSQEPMGATS